MRLPVHKLTLQCVPVFSPDQYRHIEVFSILIWLQANTMPSWSGKTSFTLLYIQHTNFHKPPQKYFCLRARQFLASYADALFWGGICDKPKECLHRRLVSSSPYNNMDHLQVIIYKWFLTDCIVIFSHLFIYFFLRPAMKTTGYTSNCVSQ